MKQEPILGTAEFVITTIRGREFLYTLPLRPTILRGDRTEYTDAEDILVNQRWLDVRDREGEPYYIPVSAIEAVRRA